MPEAKILPESASLSQNERSCQKTIPMEIAHEKINEKDIIFSYQELFVLSVLRPEEVELAFLAAKP